jgi:hypothetical protein
MNGSGDGTPSPVENPPAHPAISLLRQAITFVPVPNARPSASHADEAAGLTAVELALRLDHVTRVTEQLHLIDSGHVRRTVALDLDLRVLTERQREALTVRTREPGKPVLWVPIARQNRDHLAPVTVVDRSGSVVPRITSEATVDAVIAGMARLLRIQVAARIAARADRETEKLISVRARWLIEHAMAYLIRHGHGTLRRRQPRPTPRITISRPPAASWPRCAARRLPISMSSSWRRNSGRE